MSDPEAVNFVFSTPATRLLEEHIGAGSGFVVVTRPELTEITYDDESRRSYLPQSSWYKLALPEPDYDISALNDRFSALRNAMGAFAADVSRAEYTNGDDYSLAEFRPAALKITEKTASVAVERAVKVEPGVTWPFSDWPETAQEVRNHTLKVFLFPSIEFAEARHYDYVDMRGVSRVIRRKLRTSQGHEVFKLETGYTPAAEPQAAAL